MLGGQHFNLAGLWLCFLELRDHDPCLAVRWVTHPDGESVTLSLPVLQNVATATSLEESTKRDPVLCAHTFHHAGYKYAVAHTLDECTAAAEAHPACTIPEVGM